MDYSQQITRSTGQWRSEFSASSPRGSFLLRALVAIIAGCLFTEDKAAAQSLIDSDPYDLITVADPDGDEILKVFPLDFPDRQIPTNRSPSSSIRVRLLSAPDEEFQVQWSAIKKIELFEQRILRAAADAVRKKDYDEAFKNLAFLKAKYPKTPGLEEGMQRLLTSEASDLFREKEYERAWFLLNEIYTLNPGRDGIDRALQAVLDRLFSKRVADRDFVDARRILNVTEQRYGRSLQALVKRWEQQLESYANRAKQRAEQQLAANDFAGAYRSGQLMMEIWPETDGARELFTKLATSYPIVSVAVTQPFAESDNSFGSAASRRCERLLDRNLFEMVDVGSEGGRYLCPLGSHQVSPDGMSIQLSLGEIDESDSGLSGLTVARRLRAMAIPDSQSFSPTWWSVFEKANTKSLFEVAIELKRPHLRFESIVDDSLDNLDAVAQSIAPYSIVESNNSSDSDEEGRSQTRFRINSNYLLGSEQQPREIVEMLFPSTDAALNALRRGEVDVIARMLPADAAQAIRDNNVQAHPYRVPSTHILIPNYEDEFAADRAFRVAMLYGIDRQTILNRELMGGSSLDGCQIISGPFPRGLRSDDPISYGYNTQIEPRGYDPRLARVRLEIARVQAATAAKKAGVEPPRITKVILAHPNDEIPRIACQHIANNWRLLGLEVELKELSPGQSIPDGEWHFTYADLRVTEPLTDASRLLSSDGFAKCASPYLNLALRQLGDSENWNEAGQRLRAVHQICFDDVSVLPLWQIADHFAYRSTIDGIGIQPVSLYQNVEQWRLITE